MVNRKEGNNVKKSDRCQQGNSKKTVRFEETAQEAFDV